MEEPWSKIVLKIPVKYRHPPFSIALLLLNVTKEVFSKFTMDSDTQQLRHIQQHYL